MTGSADRPRRTPRMSNQSSREPSWPPQPRETLYGSGGLHRRPRRGERENAERSAKRRTTDATGPPVNAAISAF
jgi:hypothetical protein